LRIYGPARPSNRSRGINSSAVIIIAPRASHPEEYLNPAEASGNNWKATKTKYLEPSRFRCGTLQRPTADTMFFVFFGGAWR